MGSLEKRIEYTKSQIKFHEEQLNEEVKFFKENLEYAEQDRFLQDNVSKNARRLIKTLEESSRRMEIYESLILKHKEVLKVLTEIKEEE